MNIKEYYPNGECPDCSSIILETAKAGDKCHLCPHVFKIPDTFKKITIGYVVQDYKTYPNGIHICVNQEFIAGEVSYETSEHGDSIEIDTSKEVYCPFEMVQNLHRPFPDK